MKKLLLMLLSIIQLGSAVCAEETALITFPWERDGTSHWQLDSSGAVTNLGEHTFSSEDLLCTVCGCEVIDWGEGAYDVTDYDAYGNILRYTSFENGEKTWESLHVLICSEDGVVLSDKEYQSGELCSENTYAISEEGEQLPVKSTVWNDDGTTSVNEYDEHGNCVYAAVYAEDGAVLFETVSEFALNDDGWYYECKTTSRFDSGETFYTETNQHGDRVRVLNTYADGAVWADTVYEYEYRGFSKAWSKQYSFGKLTFEETFDADGNLMQEIEYLEDGGRIISQYNSQGDMTSAVTYAADGSPVSTTTCEYVYSEYMEQQEIREYVDGVLTKETHFHYDEESGFIGFTETFHHADGTRTVDEYDIWLELLSTTVYAPDGSVISTMTADEEF